MEVNYIFRSSQLGQFSIERVFENIIGEIQNKDEIVATTSYVPEYVINFINIIKNILYVRNCNGKIFHVTGDINYVVLGLFFKKKVLTIHDFAGIQNYKKNCLRKFFYILFWVYIPSAFYDKIVCISDKTEKEFLDICPWAKKKVSVIPDPVSKDFKYNKKIFDIKEPVILTIGNSANKNRFRLIEAARGLNCKLHFIGALAEKEKEYLDKYNIKYTIKEKLTNIEIVQAYMECDILYFASTYEGFGVPILEAQKTGRTVITSNISPLKDICGQGAILVNPYDVSEIHDAIMSIVNNKEKRKELIIKGLDNVKKYDAEFIKNAYKSLYLELV